MWKECLGDTKDVLKQFVNKKCTNIIIDKNGENDKIIFEFDDGSKFKLYHWTCSCEQVIIEDIVGDINGIINEILYVAEERIQKHAYESETYTFYTFRTIKGSLDIRWYGSSNGYYGESVDILIWKDEE
jgi:hypothetical protein